MDRDLALSALAGITTVISGTNGDIPEAYLLDGRHNRGAGLAVVAPSSNDEIFAIIDFAIENKLRIVTQGARSGLVGATVPLANEAGNTLILSMEKYVLPLEYNETDRRAIVSAGMTLEGANQELAKYGVQIPVHFSVPNALFGGMAATNVGGERVVKYGNLRQNTRGIEVVFANPQKRTYSTLHKPIKDNSVPDFTSVFIGSFGALGIITRIEIECVEIAQNLQAAWFQISNEHDLTEILKAAKTCFADRLQECEFVSREALVAVKNSQEQIHSNISMPFNGDVNRDSLFIVFEGLHSRFDDDENSIEMLNRFMQLARLDDCDISSARDVEDIRSRVSDAVRNSGAKLIANDISTITNNVHAFRNAVRSAIYDCDQNLTIADFGHLGDGGLHMNVVIGEDDLSIWDDQRTRELRRVIAGVVSRFSGSVSAEHGRGSTNREIIEEFCDPVAESLFLAVKKVADPHNILGHSGSQPIT